MIERREAADLRREAVRFAKHLVKKAGWKVKNLQTYLPNYFDKRFSEQFSDAERRFIKAVLK